MKKIWNEISWYSLHPSYCRMDSFIGVNYYTLCTGDIHEDSNSKSQSQFTLVLGATCQAEVETMRKNKHKFVRPIFRVLFFTNSFSIQISMIDNYRFWGEFNPK